MPPRKRPPADPDRFDEAVKWFRSREAVTDVEFKSLSAVAKRQSFTVAGATQLDVVQTVLDEMATAIEKHEKPAAFRARITDKLKGRFSNKQSAQLQTAFVTGHQRAYNTGRWYQLNHPDVTERFPYRLYDVVFDGKTSEICKRLYRVVVRHDSPRLLSNWPPFHHHCRTVVRAITLNAALRYGITKRFPKLDIKDDFGLAPPLHAGEIWEPDHKGYDDTAWRQYQTKLARMQARAVKDKRPAR